MPCLPVVAGAGIEEVATTFKLKDVVELLPFVVGVLGAPLVACDGEHITAVV